MRSIIESRTLREGRARARAPARSCPGTSGGSARPGPGTPVELDSRDPLAADLGHDLAGLVLIRARARPEDEPEDENADHDEQRPLEVMEAVAHRLEHRKPSGKTFEDGRL
jgi:hypothetical protein